MKTTLLTLALATIGLCVQAQNLEDILNSSTPPETNYTAYTFKSTRVINMQTIENQRANHLDFRIHHRFGYLNTGVDNFWGLDQATIKLSLEYGITDNLMVGIGRSSLQKMVDGFVKWKVLRQSTGATTMPVSVSLFANAGYNGLKSVFGSSADSISWTTQRRMSYCTQLLIARKFNEHLSLQIAPTFIHSNVVADPTIANNVVALGAGGRYKLSKRISLTGEYFYQFRQDKYNYNWDSFSLGMDIETGGHVFQLFVTNSAGMTEQQFITMNQGGWGKGNIGFGFNISRAFSLSRKSAVAEW